MHPGMMAWWKYAHEMGCGEQRPGWHGARHGWRGHEQAAWQAAQDEGDVGGSAFGVRRPLRFLAHRLELDDDQVAELARILDELKITRAQAEVDRRRTVASFADALDAEVFDAERAAQGGKLRIDSADKLRDAVEKALGRMHAILRADQRKQLAYLIRTGALSI